MGKRNKKRTLVNGLLFCPLCKLLKELDAFHNCKGATFDRAYYCKECACRQGRYHHKLTRQHDPKYKRSARDSWIKNKHGISLLEYEEKLRAQNSLCAICRVELPSSGHFTHLDHSHKTGKLRAFLCTNCNRGLGHFQDNADFLRIAADYLDSYSQDNVLTKEVIHNDSSH